MAAGNIEYATCWIRSQKTLHHKSREYPTDIVTRSRDIATYFTIAAFQKYAPQCEMTSNMIACPDAISNYLIRDIDQNPDNHFEWPYPKCDYSLSPHSLLHIFIIAVSLCLWISYWTGTGNLSVTKPAWMWLPLWFRRYDDIAIKTLRSYPNLASHLIISSLGMVPSRLASYVLLNSYGIW